MTEKNVKLRQKWALDFSRKTMKFWNRVIWTDESKMFAKQWQNRYVRKFDCESWNDERFLD